MTARVPDERLLELLLDGSDLAELDALRATPDGAERVAALERFVAKSRTVLTADEPAANAALVGRILEQTTREDLSWRGDLRLVGGFVRQRLRESLLLRVVAASLVAHVVAIPAAAWVIFRDREEPKPHLHVSFEPAEESPFADVEPEPLPDVPPVEVDGGHRAAEHAENLLRRARYLLVSAPGPAPQGEPPSAEAALEIRLLDARSRYLHGEGWADWLDDPHLARDADGAAVALLAEVHLDRLARDGERGAGFNAALARAESVADRADGAGRELLLHAVDRAVGYGAWAASDARPSEPRLDPYDAAWSELLGGSLSPEALASPAVRGWLSLP